MTGKVYEIVHGKYFFIRGDDGNKYFAPLSMMERGEKNKLHRSVYVEFDVMEDKEEREHWRYKVACNIRVAE